MAIIKCNNGHYYDDVIYHGRCPHCKAEMELLKDGKNVLEDDKTVKMATENINLQMNYPDEEERRTTSLLPGQEEVSVVGQLFDERLGELTEEEKGQTLSFQMGKMKVAPVTGWLVCVSGNEAGKDYRLHAGKNFVGRSLKMDVPIVGDKTVARNKHCAVVYEPNENMFYISSEAGNVVYLNEETVENFSELRADDVLRVGETELVMIPYCKEDRKWKSE